MKQWQYCVITGVMTNSGSLSGSYPQLSFLSIHGIEETIDLGKNAAQKRPEGFKNVSEGGYIAHWISKLGSEGWEMVSAVPESAGPGANSHSIYFRREVENR